jgi:hypothetical protein
MFFSPSAKVPGYLHLLRHGLPPQSSSCLDSFCFIAEPPTARSRLRDNSFAFWVLSFGFCVLGLLLNSEVEPQDEIAGD